MVEAVLQQRGLSEDALASMSLAQLDELSDEIQPRLREKLKELEWQEYEQLFGKAWVAQQQSDEALMEKLWPVNKVRAPREPTA